MRVYLGLGSNLGDRRAVLEAAQRRIGGIEGVAVCRMSSVYDTPPMGPRDQRRYLNAVLEVETDLTPKALLEALQGIETELGREPKDARQRWGPRVIDVDILLFAEQIVALPGLKIPHPHMAERWFVLKPLAELAGELRHPVAGVTIARMLTDLENDATQEHGTKII